MSTSNKALGLDVDKMFIKETKALALIMKGKGHDAAQVALRYERLIEALDAKDKGLDAALNRELDLSGALNTECQKSFELEKELQKYKDVVEAAKKMMNFDLE